MDTSGYQWISVDISGYQWVPVGTSGYKWVPVGTSGYYEYHKYHKYHKYRSTTSTTSTGVPGEPRVQTIGRHFRLPGHCVETDLRMLPIEIISSRNPFLLRAHESFYIEKFQTEKRFSVYELEHGLNLDRGQR